MSHIRFRPLMPLVGAIMVLPLAFGQNPSGSGNGDVFNSATINNHCQDVFKETTQKLNDAYLQKQRKSDREQAYCKNQVCIDKIQVDRAMAVDEYHNGVKAAKKTLDDCQTKPRGTFGGANPRNPAGDTPQGALLQGSVEEEVKPEQARPGVYKGGANGTALPRMTGTVVYNRTTLTVTTAAGRLVGQSIAGPVAFTSSPRSYSSMEGYISSPYEFTIHSLKDLRSRQVLRPGETITVSIQPKR